MAKHKIALIISGVIRNCIITGYATKMNTQSKAIERFAFRFKNYTYRPVQLSLNENQGLAATILLCCAVDLLAKFNSGDPAHTGNAQKYKDFVRVYFPPNYKPSEFYKFVRCGLVHSYSMENKYTILCRDEPWARQIHLLKDTETGNKIINPFQLLADLKKAVRLYICDLQNNSTKAKKFFKVHKVVPLKQQVSRWKKLKHLYSDNI